MGRGGLGGGGGGQWEKENAYIVREQMGETLCFIAAGAHFTAEGMSLLRITAGVCVRFCP